MSTKITDRAIRYISLPLGVAGLSSIAAGFYLVYELFTGQIFEGSTNVLGLASVFLLLVFFLVLGSFAIYTTIQIWTHLTASLIRSLSAIGAVVFWGVLANILQYLPAHTQAISEPAWQALMNLILLVLASLFYLFVSRWLIAKSSTAQDPPRCVSPNVVGLFCFFILIDLVNLISELSLQYPDQAKPSKIALEMYGFLASILFVGLLYKMILHLSARRIKRYKQSQHYASTPAG